MSIHQSRLERENLEAHVDLCAERYRVLEEKFTRLEEKVDTSNKSMEAKMEDGNSRLESKIDSLSDGLASLVSHNQSIKDKNMRLMVTAAGTIILGLLSVVVMLMISLQSMAPIGVV